MTPSPAHRFGNGLKPRHRLFLGDLLPESLLPSSMAGLLIENRTGLGDRYNVLRKGF